MAAEHPKATSGGISEHQFVRRALIAIGLVILALLLWTTAYALLLAFAGVLFAVFLRGLGALLHRAGIPESWCVPLVVLALAAALALGGWFMGTAIMREASDLGAAVEQGVQRLRGHLEGTPWGRDVLDRVVQQLEGLLSAVPTAAAALANGVLALLAILFVGLYVAFNPKLYARGALRLFPPGRRDRMHEVMCALHDALWLWLVGRFVVMVLVGIVTTLALWLIGMPLPVPLGVLAGLLDFIPFFGPIVASVPIVLVGLSHSPAMALYGVLAVVVIQQIEGNLLEPVVEQKAVSLPPALILLAAIAFTLVFGVPGAVFATPLLVVAIRLVKMLYVQDVLGQPPDQARG